MSVDLVMLLGRRSYDRRWWLGVSVLGLCVRAVSPNHQWRGTSEASGAWPRRWSGRCWGRRALAVQGLGDLRLPDPDKDRRCAWADGLRGLGRDGPPCERSTGVDAGYNGLRELALSLQLKHIAYFADAGAPAQSLAVWGTAKLWTKLTMSAPAGRRTASLLPGTLLAGFFPAEVWRNSGKVKQYLGGTVPKVV